MRRAERFASVVLILFGLFVSYYSQRYLKLGIMISPGAGFIPFYIGIAMTILGIIWFLNVLLAGKVPRTEMAGASGDRGEKRPSGQSPVLWRFLPGIIMIILYAWLFEKIGYILSTLFFMVGWQKAVEREGWMKTAIVAVVCAGGMYTLFAYFLKVFLPAGEWFS